MSTSTIDQSTALVLADQTQAVDLYQRMCVAIAECARIDQVQEMRNRAKALQEYTKQSKNFEAEAQLSAIRLRAERRAGELLIEMVENGERCDNRGSNLKLGKNSPASLSDLNITNDDSKQWQRLAKIPEPEFEAALAEPGVKRSYKVIAAYREKQPTAPLKKQVKRKATEDMSERSRRLICEAVAKVADGKVRSFQQISEATGRADGEGFLERVRMLPWLTIERTPNGYRLTIDDELRMICEDRAPRPQLGGAAVYSFIKRLTKEIDCKRKENHEKQKAIKWNPDSVLKLEQKRLLDWIEAELSKLIQLMATSGPDYMSAIRTRNHPSGDGEKDYVLQEEHANRAVDSRTC